MEIQPALPSDDGLFVEHYLAIWASYGTVFEDYADDAAQRVLQFIDKTRINAHHAAFIARIDVRPPGRSYAVF